MQNTQNLQLLGLLSKGQREENFKITNITIGEIPDGLTPKILQDLWQICVCFGHHKDNLLQFGVGRDKDAFEIRIIFFSSGKDNNAFGIQRPDTVVKPNFEGFDMLSLNMNAFLLWDQSIDSKFIQQAIKEIDRVATERGLIVNNQRTKDGLSGKEALEQFTPPN